VRRLLAALSAAVLTAAFLCPPPAAARADQARSDAWRAIAERAQTRLDVLAASGTQRAMTLAFAAQSHAWLSPDGWADPDALAYLTRLYAVRNPDGGWGLGFSYDAHGDGTVNPPETTYVVTLAGHVGPVLLDAYRAGAAPRADLQTIVNLITFAPRIDTSLGPCLAYSRNANDAKTGLCVHNVSAGAAAFLLEAAKDGFTPNWPLISGIARRTASAYTLTSGRATAYRDNMHPTPDDPDHQSYTTESVLLLAPQVGYYSAYYLMTTDFTYEHTPLAHMRLTGVPRIPLGADWCVLGDQWLGEADDYLTASWADVNRLAQVAYYAARDARACA